MKSREKQAVKRQVVARRRKSYLSSALFWIVIAVLLVWTLFPIYNIVLTSLKRPREWYSPNPPSQISLLNWEWMFGAPADPELIASGGTWQVTRFVTHPLTFYAMNSLIVGLGTSVLSVVIASMAGYALARFRFRGRMNLAYWILSLRALPPIAMIIPYFALFTTLNLVDTHLGLIITHTLINLPLAVWLLMSYMEDIPQDIEDASLVDGASRWTSFTKVILPLSVPGIAAVAIFSLITSWNEFLFAYVLTRTNTLTVPVHVSTFIAARGTLWGPLSVAAIISIFPVFVFTLLVQKHLIRIMTLGALKR